MSKIQADFLSKVLYYVVMAGIVAVAIGMVCLPWIIDFLFSESAFYKEVARYKILILLYITGIPAWTILWMTRRLTQNIIRRDPFSYSSVWSLKVISICAMLIFFCYLFTCLFVKMAFGIVVITIGAFMVALIAAILHRLVELAIEIKEENELTI